MYTHKSCIFTRKCTDFARTSAIGRAFCRKCSDYVINRRKSGNESDDRPNPGPMAHRPSTGLALNDPMIQWSDAPIIMILSRCAAKIRELAVKSQNLTQAYVVVNKSVIRFMEARVGKMRGEKMKVSPIMLLKTNGGKMSVFASLAMLLKKQWVISCLSRCW